MFIPELKSHYVASPPKFAHCAPHGQLFVIFFGVCKNSVLFCPKTQPLFSGSKISHLLLVRAEGADPPSPLYGQPDCKISVFFWRLPYKWLWEIFFMLVNNSWRWIDGGAFHPDKLLWLIFQFWYLSALLFKEAVKNPTLSAKCDILRGHRFREALKKHRKNCECCPGHYLIVNHYSSI